MRAHAQTTTIGRKGGSRRGNPAAGFSLLELLVACLVMTTGLLGGMVLILTAVANDSRDKNDSSATIISQMVMEMVSSVPADATATSSPSSSLTIKDCNPTTSSASHTINTLGTSTGTGAIDFSQATSTGYAMTYYGCQASTSDRQTTYDVRWYVKTISADAKLVVVAPPSICADFSLNFRSVYIERPDVAPSPARNQSGKTNAIICIASTEQNSPL